MNSKFLKVVVLSALAVGVSACSDGDNDDQFFPGGKCVTNVCNGVNTLLECDPMTGRTTLRTCPNGCFNGACNSDINTNKCLGSVCQNAMTLLSCDLTTGISTPVHCEYGCVNNACVTTPPVDPGAKCTASACRDAMTLLSCDLVTGISTPVHCEYGCVNNACVTAPPVDPGVKCTSNTCRDTLTLLVCDPLSGISTPFNCEHGCENGACLSSPLDPSDKCTADVCKDASTLLVCDAVTGIAAEQVCEHGCADGRCIDAPVDPSGKCTADVCKDASTLLVCDAVTGLTNARVCVHGCDANTNTCKLNNHAGDPCDSMTCDAGLTCNKGICVPDSMNGAQENDPWQEGWVEHCEGNKAVMNFYDPENDTSFVGIADCGAVGCSVVRADYGRGEETPLAWCNDESSRCKNVGDELGYCVEEEYNDETYAYSNKYVCMTNTEGSLTAADMGMLEDPLMCGSNMCLADKSGCRKMFDKEGDVCEEGSPDACEGTYVIGCYDSDYDGVSTWNGVDCTTHESFGAGYTCMTFDDSNVTTGYCFDDTSICEAGTEDVRKCDESKENVLIDVCKATSDGKNHIVVYKESCVHGCDPATNNCIKIDPSEDETCDPATYKASCKEGGVALNCVNSKDAYGNPASIVAADKCDTCMVIDGEAACVDACTTVDETKSVCSALDSVTKYICVQNGTNASELYWTKTDDKAVSCMIGCNADNTGCLVSADASGTKCNEAAVAECMKDAENGVVGCAIETNAAEGEATCYSGACTALGEMPGSRTCVDDDFLALFVGAYTVYDKCVETKGDGNVISQVADICESGKCNASKNGCEPAAAE